MQSEPYLRDFPENLEPNDLSVMRGAVVTAVKRLEDEGTKADKEAIAKIVFRFYRSGLVEPKKLTAIALLFAHSRLFSGRANQKAD
ncbi:hypothetical protein [Pseudorhizobium flavum]|uniref:hypothetical protein n=1 Tax=Pseudorhizobium flavum TaxID=1335061 RepID=UPI0037704CA6